MPGSYLLREFARQVVSVAATSGGRAVDIEKTDHATWHVSGHGDELTVTARIHAFDQSVRGAYLDRRRAYFNGACLFFRIHGRDAEPAELELDRPSAPGLRDWRVATAMPAVAVDGHGFGRYRARDYDELIDHPFEIGVFDSVGFEAAGVAHRLVLAGRQQTDLERLAVDLRQLCETQIDFFGRPPPFEQYWFLGLAVGDGYGGLEHRSSSSLIFSRDDLPRPGEPGVPAEYQRFLGLASHEYFHSWNIKRLKPAAFVPYRLDRRNHTRMLWVFEGITTYYQDLFLLRSELIGAEAYLTRLGEVLTRVSRVPGRFRQSLAESSFDAWDVLYKPEANTPNVSISYYTKGALVALALDLTLRRQADGSLSLDRVMQRLWQRHGEAGTGLDEGDFEAFVIELAGEALRPFFDRAVRGVEDLPLAELLAEFGVSLRYRAARGGDDKGGTPAAGQDRPSVALGANYRAGDGGLELVNVLDDSPAQRAGLAPGDVVVALDGLKVGERNLAKRLARYDEGEALAVAFFRGDELLDAELVAAPAPLDTCYLQLDSQAGPTALSRRRAWLGV